MFITYVGTGNQRRDDGHWFAVFLARRTETLPALQSAEEDRRQGMSHLHCKRRQGLQWEWYRSCRSMLEGGAQNGVG